MKTLPGVAALLLLASAAGVSGVPAPQSPLQGETIFFDDFSGTQIDRSKWNVIVTGRAYNNEQQAYVDSPDVFVFLKGTAAEGATNGALAITPLFRQGFLTPEGRKFDFVSGRLETNGKFKFKYGTAAVRAKLSAGPGLWPAFWALGTARWPDTGEIDILENVGESRWTNFAMHGPGYSGDTPLTSRATFAPTNDITAWHIYSVDWTADELVFRVDGFEKYRVTRATVSRYGAWAFDDEKYLLLNLALGGSYPQAINKVTSPYLGLPQSTVDLIKSGKGRLLVDWVRVTKASTR